LIISGDKFGKRIKKTLIANGANVVLCEPGVDIIEQVEFKRLDAIIVADYTYDDFIISNNSIIVPYDIQKHFPETKVIQFAGKVRLKDLKECDIKYYPESFVGSFKMAKTFGFLGVKPVIYLHAAGLKVGELAKRYRFGNDDKDDLSFSLLNELVLKN